MDEKVVFQGRLIVSEDKNAFELREDLTQWVSTSPSLIIQGVKLEVDDTCPVAISDFDDVECPTNTKHPKNVAAIALGSNIGVIAIAVIIIIVLSVVIVKKCRIR